MSNYAGEAAAIPGNSVFLLPLVNIPQIFNITLAGVDYTFTCRWNAADEAGWLLDIEDANTGTPLAAGIPLIVGANLLSGLEYLGIGGELYVYTNGDQFAVPTLFDLGVESNVYFITSEPNGSS